MSVPKKHHYIPKFYLEQWARPDGQLTEFRRVNGVARARSTYPGGTGYQEHLYRIDGVPPEQAQEFEQVVMYQVDTQASDAHKRMLAGDPTPWTGEMRSGWTRFVLSLIFRNPEAVQTIKTQMLAIWEAALHHVEVGYDKFRMPDDPATFEEMKAQIKPELTCGDGQFIRGTAAIHAFFTKLQETGFGPEKRKFQLGEQRPALRCGDLALTSSRSGSGTVTTEVARRQKDGTWLWVIDRFSVAWKSR